MSSRYQAIGSYVGLLRDLGIRPMSQQSFRLASTAAKPRGGKSKLPGNEHTLATKRTRFATTKPTRQDIKISRTASAGSPATPTARTTSASTTSAPIPPIKTVRTKPTPESPFSTPSSTETSGPLRTRETEVEEEPQIQMPLDPKSKEYKQAYNGAARRYTAIMVSIPLLFVTSYYLYKRLAPTVGARPPQSKSGQTSNA
ncbi:hypothetical protein QBC37DRAFT_46074 [Rhypophila decipiens]|uniref:Uncharacterized protein n=1 Tax=Rhypophila decipiens TaxID=261697 RepID=A0AAN6YJR1_9PEZI|nr:hypothetical protein QBC37DRAFT_46074 [Rhypophila decipiens]